jgi:hypothetical protein
LNSKKLADLLEEELNELNSSGGDLKSGITVASKQRQRSNSSASIVSNESIINAASDNADNRQRSLSETSNASDRVVVVRKIKRIDSSIRSADKCVSNEEVNAKKKYSCFNYEDFNEIEHDEYAVEHSESQEEQEQEQEQEEEEEEEEDFETFKPKTSSRTASLENIKISNEKAKKFDDKFTCWLDETDQMSAKSINKQENLVKNEQDDENVALNLFFW